VIFTQRLTGANTSALTMSDFVYVKALGGNHTITASAFSGGTGGYAGEAEDTWLLDETGKDVLIADSISGGSAIVDAMDIQDEWMRFSFSFAGGQSRVGSAASDLKPSWGHNDTGANGGAGGGTHSQLIVSHVSDGEILQNGTRKTNTSYPKDWWDINNVHNDFSTTSFGKWPRHMSIWLCNFKANKSVASKKDGMIDSNTDMSSQVFIDKVEFKDFNYVIDNPNPSERNLVSDTIKISASPNTPIGPNINPTDDISSSNISMYQANSPTMMSIGVTERKYLGYIHRNSAITGVISDENYKNWTSDEKKFIQFHNYSTSNLALNEEIPDSKMIATYSHAGGSEKQDDGSTNIEGQVGPRWGECYNTHYGLSGFIGSANSNPVNSSALKINNFEGASSSTAGLSPTTNIGLKYVPLIVQVMLGYFQWEIL